MTASRAFAGLYGVTAAMPTIDLATMDSAAKLRNRVDAKYLVDIDTAIRLLCRLTADHSARVLEIGQRRVFAYRSTYFDTPDLATYRAHRQGRRRRCKVRTRNYRDSGASFLEVKLKGGRGGTGKHRLAHPEHLTVDGKAFIDATLSEAYGWGPSRHMEAVLQVCYSRVTVVTGDMSSRITFDLDLSWNVPGGPAVAARPDMAVVEAKTPPDTRMRLPGLVRPQRLSKYCLGVAALYPAYSGNPWYRALRTMTGAPHADFNSHSHLGDLASNSSRPYDRAT